MRETHYPGRRAAAALLTLTICLLAVLPLTSASAAGVRFTVQPVGGTTINYSDFTITWETDPEVRVMLQMRDSDTEDWGNVDWITSPYSMRMFDFTSQYRLSAEVEEGEVYSDVFVVSWVRPEEMTTAVVSVPGIPDLLLGYDSVPVAPVRITNVGAYPIENPFLELGDIDTALELVQNREPRTILPGETDEATWSVKPRRGLGIGSYETGVYLSSPNLDPADPDTCATVWFDVLDSGAEITYELACDDVDFGKIEAGYPELDTIDLVVRNIGTGNVTNVHIYTEDANTDFFHLYRNVSSIDKLNAGMNSGTSWYIRLNGGLEVGLYETQLKVYVNECEDPLLVTVRAEIVPPGQGGGAESAPVDPAGSESGGEYVVPDEESRTETVSVESENAASGESGSGWVWIVVAAGGVLVAAIVVLAVLLARSKRNKKD